MTLLDHPLHQRASLLRRARVLNWATIGWNAIEGVVAIIAGIAAGSVGLIGFGLDSGIEVSAALVLLWRLAQEGEGDARSHAAADLKAQRAIAMSFAALALYVGISALMSLAAGERPDASEVGIVMAAMSLAVMPVLAAAKGRVALELGSRAAEAEAHQTNVCAMLSAALLLGLGANAVLGWWWADGCAALLIAAASAFMAIKTWNADSLEATCCS